jgi:hypothetical protein
MLDTARVGAENAIRAKRTRSNRLRAMLEYQFGHGAQLGFDENGFLVSLVADGWQLEGSISVHLYPNDHPPPHVHVRFRGEPRWRLRLAIATGVAGEPLDEFIPTGWSKKARKARKFVVESQDLLIGRWVEMHGTAL